tara:strand:+ start:631 stop:1191 length:561 start_codon:yes stop_codon:yes gene_type:complete
MAPIKTYSTLLVFCEIAPTKYVIDHQQLGIQSARNIPYIKGKALPLGVNFSANDTVLPIQTVGCILVGYSPIIKSIITANRKIIIFKCTSAISSYQITILNCSNNPNGVNATKNIKPITSIISLVAPYTSPVKPPKTLVTYHPINNAKPDIDIINTIPDQLASIITTRATVKNANPDASQVFVFSK